MVGRLITRGFCPWWTAPSLHLHLVRPLGGAHLALDYALFGTSPLGYHAVSLLWYAALLGVVAALFRRLLSRETALLALLVFALSSRHGAPAAWIAARHALVAAVPALLGLLALVRARTERWRPGGRLAILGMAVGLLGGETALGVIALGLAYDLLGGPRRPLRQRATHAAPLAALAAGYLAVYALVGGGAQSSGGYIEPLSSPSAFAVAAATRVPALLGDALLGFPSELVSAGYEKPAVLVGVAGVALVALLARACAPLFDDAERDALRWSLPGAALALLASAGAFPGGRLLLIPDVGIAMLLGALLRRAFTPGRLAAGRYAGAGLLALVHVALSPLLMLVNETTVVTMAHATETVAHDATSEARGASRVFLVNGSDPMASVYPRFVLYDEGRTSIACWSWLDGAKADARVTRLAPDALAIEPVGTTFLRGAFETLYRAPELHLREGDEVAQCGATVRVAALTDGRPSRIEVRFPRPIEEDGDVAVLAWQAGALRRLALPGVGASVIVPWSRGPSGFF